MRRAVIGGCRIVVVAGERRIRGNEVPAADTPTQNTAASHEITFGEEEITDVSLATFYVFDKENVGTSEPAVQLAWRGCRGCRGCGGCGGWRRGCGGCGGCGGCRGWGGCGGCGGCARVWGEVAAAAAVEAAGELGSDGAGDHKRT